MQDSNPDVIKLDRDEAIRTILQLADLFNVHVEIVERKKDEMLPYNVFLMAPGIWGVRCRATRVIAAQFCEELDAHNYCEARNAPILKPEAQSQCLKSSWVLSDKR